MALEIIKLIVLTTLSIVGIIIAVQQNQINKTHLRIALFQRRFDFYYKLDDLFSILTKENYFNDDQKAEFLKLKKEAAFLFGKEIVIWMDIVLTKSNDHKHFYSSVKPNLEENLRNATSDNDKREIQIRINEGESKIDGRFFAIQRENLLSKFASFLDVYDIKREKDETDELFEAIEENVNMQNAQN